MTMRKRLLAVACLLMLAGGVGFGQEKSESTTSYAQAVSGKHYQVVFVVQDVESGRVINSRRYATDMALVGEKSASGSIRTGSRVPIATGSYNSGSSNVGVQTQFTYVDIGFNVDFDQARLEGNQVYVWLRADLSSVDPALSGGQLHEPTIRHNSWSAGVTVPLGKPTVVFSSDDLDSKRTIQVELTVTPMK